VYTRPERQGGAEAGHKMGVGAKAAGYFAVTEAGIGRIGKQVEELFGGQLRRG
jgi:hypothetical protein